MSHYRHIPTMPWGKYRHQTIDQVPAGYLWWVLENCEQVDATLRVSIEEELASRLPQRAVTATATTIDRDYLVSWCRRAAVVCHPDHGGSVQAMKLVNELRAAI